jgi:hypothetical protein
MRHHPWMMWVVFPFVLLVGRPELHLTGGLSLLMVYLQFPMEGLLVQWVLRRRVTVQGVAGRLFYLHYLCLLQLLMISGAVGRALMR